MTHKECFLDIAGRLWDKLMEYVDEEDVAGLFDVELSAIAQLDDTCMATHKLSAEVASMADGSLFVEESRHRVIYDCCDTDQEISLEE